MTTYQIARDGTEIGSYSEEDLIEAVETGAVLVTDLAWSEDLGDWTPVAELVEEDEDAEAEAVADEALEPMPEIIPEEPLEPEPMMEAETAVVRKPVAEMPRVTTPAMPAPPREVRAQPAAVMPVPGVVPGYAAAPMPGYQRAYGAVTHFGVPGSAIGSLVCGLLGLVLGLVTGLPAIILGHAAMDRIKRSAGAYQGRGIALTGTILGYVTTLLVTAVLLMNFSAIKDNFTLKGYEVSQRKQGQELHRLLKLYATAHNATYPQALEGLVADGTLTTEKLAELRAVKGHGEWQLAAAGGREGADASRPLLRWKPAQDGEPVMIIMDGGQRGYE